VIPCSDVSLFSKTEQTLDVCCKECGDKLAEANHEAGIAYSERFDQLVPAARKRRDESGHGMDMTPFEDHEDDDMDSA